MSRTNAVRAWALAVAVMALPAACSSGEESANAPTIPTTGPPAAAAGSTSSVAATTAAEGPGVIEVSYVGGQVAGGVQRPTVRLGEKVRIRVTSDVADEVHVHTYDLKAAVAPGQPAQVDFVASIPGRHEVELERRGRHLLVLEVR